MEERQHSKHIIEDAELTNVHARNLLYPDIALSICDFSSLTRADQ